MVAAENSALREAHVPGGTKSLSTGLLRTKGISTKIERQSATGYGIFDLYSLLTLDLEGYELPPMLQPEAWAAYLRLYRTALSSYVTFAESLMALGPRPEGCYWDGSGEEFPAGTEGESGPLIRYCRGWLLCSRKAQLEISGISITNPPWSDYDVAQSRYIGRTESARWNSYAEPLPKRWLVLDPPWLTAGP